MSSTQQLLHGLVLALSAVRLWVEVLHLDAKLLEDVVALEVKLPLLLLLRGHL